eukprot:3990668-Amphidinium_carterae.1
MLEATKPLGVIHDQGFTCPELEFLLDDRFWHPLLNKLLLQELENTLGFGYGFVFNGRSPILCPDSLELLRF